MVTNGIETVRQRYESRLVALSSQVGSRNSQLLGIASLGIMAGIQPVRIEADLIAAGGFPQLTTLEVHHAVTRAGRDTKPFTPFAPSEQRGALMQTHKRTVQTHDANAADFVPRMLAAGRNTTLRSLIESSPIDIPDSFTAQTDLFFSTLYKTDDLLFCGNKADCGGVGKNIITADEWRKRFKSTEIHRAPELLIINPLTGKEGCTQGGKPSFRCSETVATWKYLLVEFDAMPMLDQIHFWGGVIASRTMNVRSITFSSGKSLHGIVELQTDHTQDQWRIRVEKIISNICNSNAIEEYRADRACRNPDRLTRLPGAFRMDKGERQPLFWLANSTTSQKPTP